MTTTLSLGLRIISHGAGHYEVTATAQDGRLAGPTLLDWDLLNSSEFLACLAQIDAGEGEAAIAHKAGDILCAAVFRDQIKDLFAGLYNERVQFERGTDLQLRLDIDERASEIAQLPWELLRWREIPLATQERTPVIRQLSNLDYGAASLRLEGRPNVLVVIPEAIGLSTAHELDLITTALRAAGLPHEVLEGRVSLQRLDDALAAGTHHVLHFIGHGATTVSPAGTLESLLRFNHPTDTGEIWVNHERIRLLLSSYRDLRLVVLNACQSATVGGRQTNDAGRGFIGMAPSILRAGVPAVVAMQHLIADEAAVTFASTFYKRLTASRWAGRVDVAVNLARQACQSEFPHSFAFVAPVLYLSSSDGQLFDLVTPETVLRAQPVPVRASGGPPVTLAPPEPARPPAVPGFVGRERVLAGLMESLAMTHAVVITGMPGVGKTWLAAALAARCAAPENTFWYEFHQGDQIQSVIWKLAAFLAWHGREDVWRILNAAPATGFPLPPPQILFDYLIQLLRGLNCLFVLDNFQLVEEDALVAQLAERLGRELQEGQFSLVLVSRRAPGFLRAAREEEVMGLTLPETRQLLQVGGLKLDDASVADLHARTEGNPQYLALACEALTRTDAPEKLICHLQSVTGIAEHLLRTVDHQLADDERDVMAAVAVLMDYGGTRGAIEATLGRGGLRRTLIALTARMLLTQHDSDAGREYAQQAMVRAYFYDDLDPPQRNTMHRNTADYYASQEFDPLRAIRHYIAAGDITRAAQIAVENYWTILNQGQAAALSALLSALPLAALDSELRARLCLAWGHTLKQVGASGPAREQFETAAKTLEWAADSTKARALKAQVCGAMGDLLEVEAPRAALTWLEQGLELVKGTGSVEEAALLISIGAARAPIGDYEGAAESVERGLGLLPAGESQQRIDALINLGWIHGSKGDTARGNAFTREALALSERSRDIFRQISIRTNLSVDRYDAADYRGAVEDAMQAWSLAERTGSQRHQAALAVNLGAFFLRLGDEAQADRYLAEGLERSAAQGMHEFEVTALSNLGELRLRQGQIAAAEAALAQAEQMAERLEIRDLLPEIWRKQAEAQLAQTQFESAVVLAEWSIALARELDLPVEEGAGLRVLGQARLTGQGGCLDEQAAAAFERSLALLAEFSPYELAQTQAAYGAALERGR